MEKPLQVFCCYAREDRPSLLSLKKHLRPLQREGLIIVQADIDVSPGEEWEQKISHYLNTAQIILLLISSDFMDSDYCYSKEMMRAMERDEGGEARVIPILLRPTHWRKAPFGKLQVLPTNAESVASNYWHTPDDAFFDVTKGIEKAAEELITQSQDEVPTGQHTHSPFEELPDTSSATRDTAKGAMHQISDEDSRLASLVEDPAKNPAASPTEPLQDSISVQEAAIFRQAAPPSVGVSTSVSSSPSSQVPKPVGPVAPPSPLRQHVSVPPVTPSTVPEKPPRRGQAIATLISVPLYRSKHFRRALIISVALSLVIIGSIVFGLVYEIQQHQLEPPTGFTVTSITLQSGQIMQRGQALGNADIPLTIQGSYTSEGSGLVWVVLRDNFGNYYLQNPPVQFNGGGTWTATNITPRSGITTIDFVAVTPDGNGTFQQMVSNGDFGAFTQLPQGSLILRSATIPINTSQIGS